MRVGFLLNDKNIEGVHLAEPELGNPGVGGTEHQIVLVAYFLKKIRNINTVIYHYLNSVNLPNCTENRIIDTEYDLIEKYFEDKLDVLVITSNSSGLTTEKWYPMAEKNNIKCILWCHCYLNEKKIPEYIKYNFIRRIIFVGKQQHDAYIDSALINKATWIYNIQTMAKEELCQAKENIVTYCGSIVLQKGFHYLAKSWNEIVNSVPDAQLYVIGSGTLYNRNSKLGKYGIADEQYENKFIKYLIDYNGNIINSVHFMGRIDDPQKKNAIYLKTKVGCVNPSGDTECCCTSAMEMSAVGIPVVTAAKNGQFDVVHDGVNGKLIKCASDLAPAIITLLKNDDYNHNLGINGIQFVKRNFDAQKICLEWEQNLQDVVLEKKVKFKRPNDCWFVNHKLFKLMIHDLKKLPGLKKLPRLSEMKRKIKNDVYRC